MLGIPNIDMLNIININCSTIDTPRTDSVNNCCTNTAICQSSRHVQQYTNMMQEVDRARKCYANTDSISEFKIKDKPMVNDKEPNTANISFQALTKIIIREWDAEITQQLQRDSRDVFHGIGCFNGIFSLELKPGSKTCGLHATKAF